MFQFNGCLDEVPIRILLDSGSTHTFLSESVASQCSKAVAVAPPVTVQVANGQLLHSSQVILGVVWSMQGLEFQQDLKMLPPTSYDMILGLDWLEQHSPMKIHWAHKWLQLPYKSGMVQMNGSLPEVPGGSVLQLCDMMTAPQPASTALAPEIQSILVDYADLFESPSQLPPSRACDHAIPLILGTGPIYSRPYRFALAIKDEIEKQVKEMLASGLIQKSSSILCTASEEEGSDLVLLRGLQAAELNYPEKQVSCSLD